MIKRGRWMKAGLWMAVVALPLLAGCSTMNKIKSSVGLGRDSGPATPGVVAPVAYGVQDVDIISMSHAIADSLVAELQKNQPSYRRNKPMLVTTLVDLAKIDQSTELGMLISDQVASRMTQHGYAVVEARMRQQLSIRPNEGEFILSRDIDKLSAEYKAFTVLVGNYTTSRDLMYLTAKIIRVEDKQVLASVSAKLPIGANTRDLLIETGSAPSLKVVDK